MFHLVSIRRRIEQTVLVSSMSVQKGIVSDLQAQVNVARVCRSRENGVWALQ